MKEASRDYRPRSVRLALFLMAIGIAIYITFRVSGGTSGIAGGALVMAGMAWIAIGSLFVLKGLLDLRRSPKPRWRATLLLLTNFPVALLCAASAFDVSTRTEVYVENESGTALTNVRLVIRYQNGVVDFVELPDMAPGRRLARAIRTGGDCGLHLEFRAGGSRHEVLLYDYLSGVGGYVEATIGAGLDATISTVRPTFVWPIIP